MKKILLSLTILISSIGMAQISDSVSLGAGYVNESYYSLEDGEVVNIDNNTWDIAFDLSGYGATIKLNRKQSIMHVYPGSIEDWATLDTAGISTWDSYTDTYDYWSQGAFNNCADSDDDSDMGWGLYNTVTHFIDAERLFVIELGTGDFKKLFVEQLASGVYTFKYANLDNTDEINEAITKADYADKNFIYYSIENEEVVDREPISDSWDIVFTNVVLELAPEYFGGVTNALHNYGVTVSEIADVPSVDATYASFEDQINTIGSDWKTFDMGDMAYVIEDSLTYFIQTVDGDVWKLVFTGFNGSIDGKIYFTKEKIEFAGIMNEITNEITLYPNPANQMISIQTNGQAINSIALFNVAGQLVYSENVQSNMEIIQLQIDDLEEGIYFLNMITNENGLLTERFIIKH